MDERQLASPDEDLRHEQRAAVRQALREGVDEHVLLVAVEHVREPRRVQADPA
jgi:hypothetical protein